MFQTIIVAVDGRPQDAEACALARRLADPGAEIIVASIAVVDRASLRGTGALVTADLIEAAESVVDAVTEGWDRAEGLATAATSVGAGLRDLALGADADLIVVASSRRGLVGRIFAGDAVRDVLRRAPCPVAVATVGQAEDGPLGRVVVGFDGGTEARRAVEHAARLGRRDGAQVDVIEVVEPVLVASATGAMTVGGGIAAGAARARAELEEVLAEYGLRGVVATGSAAHELARAGRGADLIVIGLRTHDLLDRLVVGSTAHALLREQSASLLVAPPASVEAARGTHRPVADALDQRS